MKEKTFWERYGLDLCLEEEKAFCASDCPFHMDITGFLSKIEKKRWGTAYADLRNATAFPEIISALCDERCVKRCPRRKIDDPIKLKELETVVIAKGAERGRAKYNLPEKKERVAVIGAGIKGMACALRLCEKKYQVTVFEKSDRIGGHLNELLESDFVKENILKQFADEKVEIVLGKEIRDAGEIEEAYHAVYKSTDEKEGAAHKDIMRSCKEGIEDAKAIEFYLKTGKYSYTHENIETCLPEPNLEDIKREKAFLREGAPADGEAAVKEAKRCLRCTCDACKKSCDLLSYFGKPLLKSMEEIRATTEVKGVLGENMTVAAKLIALCDQCGRCVQACPENIDIKKVFFDAKRKLLQRNDVPWAFYYNFIRDMNRANSRYDITKIPDNSKSPARMFFPGCRLGAMGSRYVTMVYDYLKKTLGDVALAVRCCGMPAYAVGDTEKAETAVKDFENLWKTMGRPEVIFACPSCRDRLGSDVKGLKASYLYEYIEPVYYDDCREISVFDPCGGREQTELHDLIRRKLEKAGYELLPLKYERSEAKCCGFTSNMHEINRSFEKYVSREKKKELGGERLLVTYCANCKNILNRSGVKTVHYLDLFVGMEKDSTEVVDINSEEENRRALMDHYGCNMEENNSGIALQANEAVMKKLDENRILMEDLEKVIGFCEETGNKIINEETGTFTGHRQEGYMTFWAEYRPLGNNCYELVNAYSHRMRIVE